MKITSFLMNRPVCLLFKPIYNLHPILLSICCITAPSRLCPDSACPAHHIFTDWIIDHISFLPYCQLCASFFQKIKPATRPVTIIPAIIFFFMAHLLSVHLVTAGETTIPRICIWRANSAICHFTPLISAWS